MQEMIIKVLVDVATTLLLTLIGVAGTWLTMKIAKRQELASIAAATNEATSAAQRVVLELQQTVVEAMKAASEDGKLPAYDIEQLGAMLLEKALAQMSVPAVQILAAAGKDVKAIIQSAGEAAVLAIKNAN